MATNPTEDGLRRRIDLKILSPSAEASGGLRFPDTLLSTTIAELKSKIRDELPTHPPLERLRLIYLGRASRDSESLVEVLGRNLQQDSPHIMHLVISDPRTHPHLNAPRSSSVPPDTRAHALRQPLPLPTASRNVHHPLAQQALPTQTPPLPPPPQPPQFPQAAIHGRIQALQGHVQGLNAQEVMNNLLNQHFTSHGILPQPPGGADVHQVHLHPTVIQQQQMDLTMMQDLAREQQRLHQQAAEGQQNQGAPPEAHSLPSLAPDTRRHWNNAPIAAEINAGDAREREARRLRRPAASPGTGTGAEAADSAIEGRSSFFPPQGSSLSGTNTPSGVRTPHVLMDAPNTLNQPPSSVSGPPPGPSSSTSNVTQTASGVTPQGHRWTMTVQNGPPIPVLLNQGLPGGSPFPQAQFNGQVPLPLPPQPFFGGLSGMAPNRLATPPVGHAQFGHVQNQPNLSRSGTPTPGLAAPPGPRSVSPARSVSEGQHPPVLSSMRSQLDNVRRGVENLGRIIGASNHGNAQTSDRNREVTNYIRAATELDQSLQYFDANFNIFLSRHPYLRTDGTVVQIQIIRQGIQAMLAQLWDRIRVDYLLRSTPSPLNTSHLPASTAPQAAPGSQPSTAPQENQIYVVTDPAGQPQALLVGPSGQYTTTHLPADVQAALLSAQLTAQIPTDQLARSFNQLLQEVYVSTLSSSRQRHRIHHHHTPNGNVQATTGNQPDQHVNANEQENDNNDDNNGMAGNLGPLRRIIPAAVHDALIGGRAAALAPAPLQRAQAREPDEMRDLLAPIVRNLWLVIRIAGLLYFLVGGGRISWRPLLIVVGVVLIYGAQAGLFGDRLEMLRRYLDRVVGAEPREQANRHAIDGQRDAEPAQDRNGQQGVPQVERAAAPIEGLGNADVGQRQQASTTPRPEDIARRLVQQRTQQDSSWLSRQLRNAERTLALFVASLWPGIGEQAVRLQAARDEREQRARREAEEAAEEERRKQEEEKAQLVGQESTRTASFDALMSGGLGPSNGESSSMAAARASAVDTSDNGPNLSRVNKGKQRATEEDIETRDGH